MVGLRRSVFAPVDSSNSSNSNSSNSSSNSSWRWRVCDNNWQFFLPTSSLLQLTNTFLNVVAFHSLSLGSKELPRRRRFDKALACKVTNL
jgi:hypothetical protein